MNYILNITKVENNENFEKEMEAYRESQRYGGWRNEDKMPPRQEITKNVIQVYLTEEEFLAVKKATLDAFK